MSYHPADDTSGLERCTDCRETWEDHHQGCACGHAHYWVPNDNSAHRPTEHCSRECDDHKFIPAKLCPGHDGQTFNTREARGFG